MGLQVEFNWYIVLKDKNITNSDDHNALDDRELSKEKLYEFIKEDYRIYPLNTPLPLVYNGKCLALACIEEVKHSNESTTLYARPVLLFEEDDVVAQYYESSFIDYKRQQQQIDDGGKIDLRQVVNPIQRRRI